MESREKIIPVYFTDGVEDGWPKRIYLERSFQLKMVMV
jgi:hypothetical protein